MKPVTLQQTINTTYKRSSQRNNSFRINKPYQSQQTQMVQEIQAKRGNDFEFLNQTPVFSSYIQSCLSDNNDGMVGNMKIQLLEIQKEIEKSDSFMSIRKSLEFIQNNKENIEIQNKDAEAKQTIIQKKKYEQILQQNSCYQSREEQLKAKIDSILNNNSKVNIISLLKQFKVASETELLEKIIKFLQLLDIQLLKQFELQSIQILNNINPNSNLVASPANTYKNLVQIFEQKGLGPSFQTQNVKIMQEMIQYIKQNGTDITNTIQKNSQNKENINLNDLSSVKTYEELLKKLEKEFKVNKNLLQEMQQPQTILQQCDTNEEQQRLVQQQMEKQINNLQQSLKQVKQNSQEQIKKQTDQVNNLINKITQQRQENNQHLKSIQQLENENCILLQKNQEYEKLNNNQDISTRDQYVQTNVGYTQQIEILQNTIDNLQRNIVVIKEEYEEQIILKNKILKSETELYHENKILVEKLEKLDIQQEINLKKQKEELLKKNEKILDLQKQMQQYQQQNSQQVQSNQQYQQLEKIEDQYNNSHKEMTHSSSSLNFQIIQTGIDNTY